MRKIYFTKTLKEKYPEFKVVFAILKDIHTDLSLNDYLKNKKEEIETFVRENLSFLLDKTNEMDNFFKMLRAPKYPIKSLLEATAKGRPIKLINPLVDIILFAELNNSILMGLHDLDKIKGDIYFDVLENPQEIKSLFGGSIILQKNDIVIKDNTKLFASLSKGPDIETKVTERSKNIIIFAFLYPSEILQKGEKILKDVVEEIITLTKAELVKISEAEEER
jgi:DNA/RNA-binding domain of Phe-tRNA-synthetase-like protein